MGHAEINEPNAHGAMETIDPADPRSLAADMVSIGPAKRGRPKTPSGSGVRETRQIEPNQFTPQIDDTQFAFYRRVPRRTNNALYSLSDLESDISNDYKLLDVMPEISAEFMRALQFMITLANSGCRLSVKTENRDDEESRQEAEKTFLRCNEKFVSEVPQASIGMTGFVDALIAQAVTRGAIATEIIPTADLMDVREIVTWEPLTAEFVRDPDNYGKYIMAQKRSRLAIQIPEDRLPNGQMWPRDLVRLNPNLCTYYTLDADDLYGRSPIAAFKRILPYWMRYLADAQLFLKNAAFGFLDASLDNEAMMSIWENAHPKTKAEFQNDFLKWCQATLSSAMKNFNERFVREPDSIAGHLGIINVKGNGSSANTFPLEAASRFLKREVWLALGIPPALAGEQSHAGAAFETMEVSAFVSYLCRIQKAVASVVERMVVIRFWITGWTKKTTIECVFNRIEVDNHLTREQARQVKIQNEVRLRDENFQSQDATAQALLGRPAIGPAPLSDGANQDGPSAPTYEVLTNRLKGSGDQVSVGSNATPGDRSGGGDKKRKGNKEADNNA